MVDHFGERIKHDEKLRGVKIFHNEHEKRTFDAIDAF